MATNRDGLTESERLDRGLCVNGCGAPICPPSRVICRACMDQISETLRGLAAASARDEQRRRAALVCVLFAAGSLLDYLWPVTTAPHNDAFIGIIIAIASAVSTFFHAFGSATVLVILRAWELLRSGVVQLARALKTGLWDTGRFLARAVQSLRGVWTHVLKPALAWANRKLTVLETWLKTKFAPILRKLAWVKAHVDWFYKSFVRPVLDVIDFIRAVNRVLQVFHINLLRKLDEVLGKIEQRIEDPFLWVRAHITELENWIDRIVTLDGLFLRVTLLRSLAKNADGLTRVFWNSQNRGGNKPPLFEPSEPLDPRTVDETVGRFAEFLERDSGDISDDVDRSLRRLFEELA